MIIEKKIDKQNLKNEFFALIIKKGFSFRKFCFFHKLDYVKEYRKCFNKKFIETDNVQILVNLIDKDLKVKFIKNILIISK